jgi:hypothetical protein
MGWALCTFVAAGVTMYSTEYRTTAGTENIDRCSARSAGGQADDASMVLLSLPQMELHNVIPRWL